MKVTVTAVVSTSAYLLKSIYIVVTTVLSQIVPHV